MTPIIRFFTGYVPNSPTLVGPLRMKGSVQHSIETRESSSRLQLKRLEPARMGADMPPGTLVWFDTSAPLENGQLALYWVRDDNGRVDVNCKRLFFIESEGQWFAACRWYILPVKWMVGVIGWAAIVAELQFSDGWHWPNSEAQVYESKQEEDAWRAEANGHAINQRAIARLAEMLGVPR